MPAKVLNRSTVHLDDPAEVLELTRVEGAKAVERVQAAVRRLQEAGLADANGRRIRTDLPHDMQPGSATDFGG